MLHFSLKRVDPRPSSSGTNTQALCSGFVAICGDKLDVHVVGGLDYKFVGTTTVSSAATHDAGLLVVDATLTIKLTDATKRAEVQSAVLPKEYLFGTKSTTNLYTPNRTRLTLLMSLKSNDLDRHKTFEGLFADDSEQVGCGDWIERKRRERKERERA